MNPIPARMAASVRTVWPMVLGVIVARLVVLAAPVAGWIERTFGIEVTEAQVAVVVGVALGWVIYEVGRLLEAQQGAGRVAKVARGLGRFVLSLGLPTGTPVYVKPGEVVKAISSTGGLRTLR